MQVIAEMQKSLHSTDTARAAQPEGLQVRPTVTPKHKGPSKADLQAELFTELVFGGKIYTAEQMAHKLARLMKLSDVKSDPVTPAQMSLLYDYYGSVHSACDTLRVGFEPLLTYLCDTLVYDPRMADVLPDSITVQAGNIKTQMKEGLGGSFEGIVVRYQM